MALVYSVILLYILLIVTVTYFNSKGSFSLSLALQKFYEIQLNRLWVTSEGYGIEVCFEGCMLGVALLLNHPCCLLKCIELRDFRDLGVQATAH